MTHPPELGARIQDRFSSLPAKQQAVARVLTDRAATLAFSSVHEVARRAGVDAATVVRTCQSLGYSGWRELLGHLKGDAARQRTFAERVAALEDQEGNLTALIHENARRNVDDTFEALGVEKLQAVAESLSSAGTALIVAGGASKAAGEYLTSSLQIIGIRSGLVSGVSDAASALAALDEHDAVVGLSMWRYLKSTVEVLKHAKEDVGARTIVLTDSPVSSATRYADHVLVASTTTVGPRLSMTGVIALVEALVACTALLDPRRSQAAAAAASDLYFDGHVLGDPAPRQGEIGRSSWEVRLAEEINRG